MRGKLLEALGVAALGFLLGAAGLYLLYEYGRLLELGLTP